MNHIAFIVIVLPVLLLATNLAACNDTNALSDREVANRLEYIRKALDDGEMVANVWWYGWFICSVVATVGQAVIYSQSNNENQRQDMLVGTGSTALGVVGQFITPMAAGYLPMRLRAIPDSTPKARRIKLVTAEAFLRRSAAVEKQGRSWQTHAITGVVNLAAGLVIWRCYNRSASDGLVTFAVGQIISEIQIFTQPMKAIRDLREYEGRTGWEHASAHVNWYIGFASRSMVVGLCF